MSLFLGAILGAQAKPDFTASEITVAKPTVQEGEVARFQLRLRNGGDQSADPVEVRIRQPLMGHVVEVSGLENAKTDDDAREVTGTIPLPKSGEHVVEVAVLAPRDAAGQMLSLTVKMIHYHTMAENWLHASVQVDTRPRSDVVRFGGILIAPAGLAVLGWLLATALAIGLATLMARGRTAGGFFGPVPGVVAIMIAIGFWLVFAAMAWRDYSVLRKWQETTGTIVGRRVTMQTSSSSDRSGSTSRSRTSHVQKPEFALRYQAEGREMLSTGYDTGSSLRTGGGKAQLAKEFQEWTVGTQVRCWYDPRDPRDVVIKRGFGGAYIFALLPLIPFLLGCWILRRVW